MEEIQWFGQTSVEGKNPYRYVEIVLRLMGNPNLKNEGVYFPYTYVYTLEDISTFSPLGVDWPVVCRVCCGNELNCPPTVIKNQKELTTYVENAVEESPNGVVLVSLPIWVDDYNFGQHTSYYLAKDYLATHNTKENQLNVIRADNSGLFERTELDNDLVYRFVRSYNNFYIESFFDHDDPVLAPITRHLRDSMKTDEDWAKFRRAYHNGFCQAPSLQKIYCEPTSGSYSPDVSSAGYLAGVNVKMKLRKILNNAGLCTDNITTELSKLVWLYSLLQETTINTIESLVETHNFIVSGTGRNKVLERCDDLLSGLCIGDDSSYGLRVILDGLFYLVWRIWESSSLESSFEEVCPILLPPREKLNFNFCCNAEVVQIRILEKHPEHVTFRLQISGFHSTVDMNGEIVSQNLCAVKHNKIEISVDVPQDEMSENINHFISSFEEHEHTRKSMEGTQMMYVPAKVNENNEIETLSGMILVQSNTLLRALKDAGILKFSFSNL